VTLLKEPLGALLHKCLVIHLLRYTPRGARQFALIVDKIDNLLQQPPNSLDRMHASLPKQVAYNQRVLRAGQETDGINCDLADFLSQMELSPDAPVIVCVNASGSLVRKHEQHVGGQLWLQGDRR
jgi:hypothetical protein